MTLLYNFFLAIYNFLVWIASFFNKKANFFIQGRKNVIEYLRTNIKESDKVIWFHAASLGEFEQGRPVIEAMKQLNPEYKVLLTFFSPSGYEIRKNYNGADLICYLPIDYSWNAKKFLDTVMPIAIYFIKYEFWHNYVYYAHARKIKIYCFSSIFRPGQVFFKWYGIWYKSILYKFNHLFVQNELSKSLLDKIGIHQVTICGDTRFDRVQQIASQTKELPLIEKFCNNQKTVICGSTWAQDEELLAAYINENINNVKFIIAPHEIHESNILSLKSKITKKVLRYSEAYTEKTEDYSVLIIDNIGMLSSIYKYGVVSYIGGGFGKGIHNILEAATFGLPVIFGPTYKKFHEAVELVELKGAFPITNYVSLKNTLDKLLTNESHLSASSSICKSFVSKNVGATKIILQQANF